jgi:5-methylcytosine-specific restriction endonuclease McrA
VFFTSNALANRPPAAEGCNNAKWSQEQENLLMVVYRISIYKPNKKHQLKDSAECYWH